jgi:hypothetical protein
MSRAFTGGKRNREAARDLKKREKAARLRRNRELRAQGIDPDLDASAPAEGAALPEVKLEDVVISVRSQPRQGDFGPTKLFVGGLASSTTAANLRAHFGQFGEVVDALVVVNRSTGHSRGFGFVSYRSSAEADAATKATNGVQVDGQLLRVNRAEARPGRY